MKPIAKPVISALGALTLAAASLSLGSSVAGAQSNPCPIDPTSAEKIVPTAQLLECSQVTTPDDPNDTTTTTAPPVIPPILDCGRWTAHDGAVMIGLKNPADYTRYRGYDRNGGLIFDSKVDWPQGSQLGGGARNGIGGAWSNWSAQPHVVFLYGHNSVSGITGSDIEAIAKVKQVSLDGQYESPGKACAFYGNSSPVALDLDGSGAIERAGHGVSFDLAGDGSAQRLDNWFGAGDGILVDTRVAGPVSGKALFGDEGGRFADGYAKLATLDSNGDGAVSGAELVGLGVWNDNGDAVVQAGEIRSLAAVGVTSISTSHTAWTSTATTTSGPIATEDVWFNAED